MYVTTEPLRAAARSAAKVPPTVLALGVVSLLTDISAEMVTAFLPMYLVYGLGAGYLQLGVVDGVYTGATAILRLVGGHVADRTGRPKRVALVGYGLSAVTKLGFPLAGSSLGGIGGLIAADRAGKGIRTGPRDAMIALATPADHLGRAFGVHRSMDTVGALLGPVVAFALVSASASTAIFPISFCFAAAGVVVLAVWVREPWPVRRSGEKESDGSGVVVPQGDPGAVGPVVDAPGVPSAVAGRRAVRVRDGLALLRDRAYRRICGLAVLLGLVTASDAFVLVGAQQRAGVGPGWLPLLPVVVAGVFLAAAVPVGRLADRVGRWPVFVGGHVLLLGVYVLLGSGLGGWGVLVVALGAHGLFYAATDGVLMACAAPLLPDAVTTSGLAVVQTGQALARTVATVVFGVIAAGGGLGVAFWVFGGGLVIGLGVSGRWRP